MDCVVLPALNEAGVIANTINRIKRLDPGIKILVVDGGSTDGTDKIARDLGAVVIYEPKPGVGPAVLTGLYFARRMGCTNAVVADADGQHELEKIPTMLALLSDGYDIVVGYRTEYGFGPIRRLISAGAEFATKVLIPRARGVRDAHGNFFALKLSLLDGLDDDLSVRDGVHNVLPYLLHVLPWRSIAQIPYRFSERAAGKSKLSTKRIITYLLMLLSISPIAPWLAAGASGVVVNLVVSALVYNLFKLVTTAGLAFAVGNAIGIEASIINNYLVLTSLYRRLRHASRLRSIAEYHAAALSGVATQFAIANALFDLAHIHYVLALIIGILAGAAVNYLLTTTRVVY